MDFHQTWLCIDFMEIWFGMANGQISKIFTDLPARDTIMAGYYSLTFFFLFEVDHNLFIRLLLGSKAKIVLAKQLCCIQTRVYRLYRKNGYKRSFFYIIYTFL